MDLLPAPVPPAAALATVTPADRHPAAVYLARLAPGSRRTMRAALATIAGLLSAGRLGARALDWSQLRYQHAAAVRASLAERYSAASANKHLAALRGVAQEAWRLGQLPAEEYQRIAALPGVRGSTLPRGRALAPAELRALFAACAADRSPVGVRDGAILSTLYGCGLRRSELVALELADFDPLGECLTIQHGKGNKARHAYLAAGAGDALARWLKLRGDAPGPLFCPIRAAGPVLRPLSAQAVYVILRKRAGGAGVARFSPHDLRRSFVSGLLDAGADLSTVRELAGHANVQTTARYDRRGEERMRRAAALLHIPMATAG